MTAEIDSTALMALPQTYGSYLTAGFFAVCTVAATILFHLLASHIFLSAKQKGPAGPLAFGILSLVLGLAGIAFGLTIETRSLAMLVGLASGFLLWLCFGEVGQEMGWVSMMSRSAVPMFLLFTAAWLGCILLDALPHAVLAAIGYPVCIWGINLTRVRIISKWGPSSLAATVLALATAAVAGGSLVLGVILRSPVSGI
ncbi:MAG TPA: hypothetical protein PKV37_07130, partial [Candidatus Fermentibacter daniensis]|nr:hypothetical protein [Candidatus Fermentibacter daniensis]